MRVCNRLAVADRQVREAFQSGACSRKQRVERLGVGRARGKRNDEA